MFCVVLVQNIAIRPLLDMSLSNRNRKECKFPTRPKCGSHPPEFHESRLAGPARRALCRVPAASTPKRRARKKVTAAAAPCRKPGSWDPETPTNIIEYLLITLEMNIGAFF